MNSNPSKFTEVVIGIPVSGSQQDQMANANLNEKKRQKFQELLNSGALASLTSSY
jgi:hypothetical protein